MSTKINKLEPEIHNAEIDRSLALVSDVWDSNKELPIAEMCIHLNALADLVDNTSNFSEFVESANLSGLERLN